MKSGHIVVAAALLTFCSYAEDPKTPAPSAVKTPIIKTSNVSTNTPPLTKENISYAVGLYFTRQIKGANYEFDLDELTKAIKDGVSGKPRFQEPEVQGIIQGWQAELRAKADKQRNEDLVKNKKEGEDFLAANAKKPGVKTTDSGLQYKVIKDGTGAKPKTNDTVVTDYVGHLISGTEFDSSIKRGKPAEFPVTGVIKGWTEALLMMNTGSKWELYIPGDLAYGPGGRPGIPPNSTLIFEIELKDIKPAPEETVHAVSGEIIKVPSKDELAKGAKIEVINTNNLPKTTNTIKLK